MGSVNEFAGIHSRAGEVGGGDKLWTNGEAEPESVTSHSSSKFSSKAPNPVRAPADDPSGSRGVRLWSSERKSCIMVGCRESLGRGGEWSSSFGVT